MTSLPLTLFTSPLITLAASYFLLYHLFTLPFLSQQVSNRPPMTPQVTLTSLSTGDLTPLVTLSSPLSSPQRTHASLILRRPCITEDNTHLYQLSRLIFSLHLSRLSRSCITENETLIEPINVFDWAISFG